MGSKSRIAKYIVPIIQDYIDEGNIDTYIEPFVGGANIIDKIHCKNKYGSDSNKYLIALLNRVKDGGELYEKVPRELYDKVREAFKKGDSSEFEDWEFGNIGFLASFNGKFFQGGYAKTGYEKTKNGDRLRDYYQESKRNILAQAPNLKDTEFSTKDYREALKDIEGKAVIYVDPPYQNTTAYSNSSSFDYEEFWNIMREWSKEHIVLVSEQNAPDDFECIWEQEVSRSLSAANKSRATEKLFMLRKG